MRILELILHRYTRLAFSAIETIHYVPTQDTQLIIGTNGSGKSSFLNELNPLPPNKNFMLNGGYKIIRIEHRGIEYTLKSTYGKHNKHSFIEHHPETGDKELNDGGTGVAQKVLIEKVFGLNIDLLRIWIGRTKFTELPPIKRRDWILRLSGNDLDFAMQVFNMAKKETSAAQAVEKHFITRLAEESADIADKNRIAELEDSVARVTADLTSLLEHKDNTVPTVAVIQNDIDRHVREFDDCVNEIFAYRLVKPAIVPNEINSVEGLKELYAGKKAVVDTLRVKLQEHYDQKKTVQKTVDTLNANGVASAKELKEVTQALRAERDALIASTPIWSDMEYREVSQVLGRFQGCRSLLVETLSVLRDNSDGYYSRERLAKARETLGRLNARLGSSRERRYQLQHAIEHFNSMTDVDCPKCTHTFKPGMVDFDLHSTQNEIATLDEQIAKDIEKIKAGEEYCSGAQDYIHQVNGVKRIIADNPDLEALWKQLVNEGLYRVAPQSHLPTILQFDSQLENCVQVNKLNEQIKLNRAVIDSLDQSQAGQVSYTDNYASMIDDHIANTITEIDNTTTQMKVIWEYMTQVTRSNGAANRGLEIYNKLADLYEMLIRSNINRSLNDIIQEKQLELASANGALTKISRHDAVVQEIQNQKDKATEKHKDYHAIMSALSPVDGLISRYIQSFLNVFIEDVNVVIGDIWTSDLEILPCGVDSSDVTCKFPLSVNNGFLVTPDISEASDGQMDVINFAFRMVVGEYLGLNDYPLYLDELAPTLDEQHRENLIRYVNNLMENNSYEQMFMISHYAGNHYAFANSEFLMMDGRNIINKPGEYNKHVTISYSDEIHPDLKKVA